MSEISPVSEATQEKRIRLEDELERFRQDATSGSIKLRVINDQWQLYIAKFNTNSAQESVESERDPVKKNKYESELLFARLDERQTEREIERVEVSDTEYTATCRILSRTTTELADAYKASGLKDLDANSGTVQKLTPLRENGMIRKPNKTA